MATPPTFVSSYASAWNANTSPKSTGTFNASTGDVLVSAVADANDNGTENYAWSNSGGSAGTFTEVAESSGLTNNDIWLQGAYLVTTGAIATGAVTATRTAGSVTDFFGVGALHFTGSDGIGTAVRQTGNGTATASFAITTAFDNSAVVCFFADWAAADGTVRTWRTVNSITPTVGNGFERVYFRDSATYAVYAAYYPDVGTAGAKTVGLTAPGSADFIGVAVEVLGTAGAAAYPFELLTHTPRAY